MEVSEYHSVKGSGKICDPRFEICVGAILTQNTSWTNVEKALVKLHQHDLLNPEKIVQAKTNKILQAIRSAGYYNQKIKKLKLFSGKLIDNGGLDKIFKMPVPKLRKFLLSVWGIGRETADSIILYAAKKPIFVVDTYSKRMLNCFGIKFNDYDEYRDFFEKSLPKKTKLWNEYHALIVAWGKLYNKDKILACEILKLGPS